MAAEIALHMYNISVPLFEANFKRKMKTGAHIPFRQVGAYEGSTPKQIVKVVKEVMGNDRISVMRIMSHGNAGSMFFPGLQDYRVISMAYVDLRSLFTALGRLELHGCGVASETDTLKPGVTTANPRRSDSVPGTFTGNKNGRGLVFLKRVASFFNVPTVGAVNVQPLDTWSYEGDTVTAYPFSDKFRMDSEGTRIFDFDAMSREAARFFRSIVANYGPKEARAALARFRELAKNYPNTDSGVRAAKLTLDEVEKLLTALEPDWH